MSPMRPPPNYPPPDAPPTRALSRIALGLFVLAVAALAFVLLASVLQGCPMPAPDGCTPRATRCDDKGRPQVCSATQRWTTADRPCGELQAVCCAARSPYGRTVHACVPAAACVPDTTTATDGGAP